MEPNAKQQVAEKLRSSNSVLITVSDSPSVDQLAAALGLALMMDALNKHTTAVFSGTVPNTMEFLDPTKTFEDTVEGLRDFIISLDKEKADKLRYKVEDDVVKIFITPYKDAITDKDLRYSQGDYNVDLVIALGVHNRDELDNAITSHGRILHDATIVTINAGEGASDGNLGSINWGETSASCICEMLVSISEALQGGIIDEQMSTAFLTGIVAATERFKNENTTPKIMTMAAQLMAAGANQQLIATNLQLDDQPKAKNESDKEVAIDNSQDNPDDDKPAESDKSDKDKADKDSQDKKSSDEAEPQWQLGGSNKTEQVELGSTNEDSIDPEILAKIKEINRVHAASALAPATKGKRKRSKKKKQADLNGPNPSIDEDSFNATSAEVKRRNARTMTHGNETTKPNNPNTGEREVAGVPPVAPAQEQQKPAAPEVESSIPAKPEVAAKSPDQELVDARAAVESAVAGQFNPDNNPIAAINAQPMSDHGDMSADIQGSAAPEVASIPAAPPVQTPTPAAPTQPERITPSQESETLAIPSGPPQESIPQQPPAAPSANDFALPSAPTPPPIASPEVSPPPPPAGPSATPPPSVPPPPPPPQL